MLRQGLAHARGLTRVGTDATRVGTVAPFTSDPKPIAALRADRRFTDAAHWV